jgi:RNA polymerase primary sigma factor
MRSTAPSPGECGGQALPADARPMSSRDAQLLRSAQRGDRDARDRLFVSRLGVVRSIASRYRGFGVPFEDLCQEGSLGLLEAIDRYDSRHGASFDTYARFRVRRAIRNALTDQARLIRLPKRVVERRRALGKAEARLTAAAQGRAPTPAQLADATGLSVAAVLEARSAALASTSFDGPVSPDGSSLASLVADPRGVDPERKALEHEEMDLLNAALSTLPERKRRVVSRRWGIGHAPVSNGELADALELSPRRTQSIERDALYELRAALGPVRDG